MGRRVVDLTGGRFGRYSVLAFERVDERRGAMWRCQCACGQQRIVAGHELRRGTSKSCGCLHDALLAERNRTHGATGSYTFRVWAAMKRRCLNRNDISYKNYGGRGITVCESWLHSFESFLADIGPAPSDLHTIDRIRTNGNYEPGNCRWATMSEQARNRRTNVFYSFQGQQLVLKDIAAACGVSESTLRKRLKAGHSVEEATQPVRRARP